MLSFHLAMVVKIVRGPCHDFPGSRWRYIGYARLWRLGDAAWDGDSALGNCGRYTVLNLQR